MNERRQIEIIADESEKIVSQMQMKLIGRSVSHPRLHINRDSLSHSG
jgi:hypothetical protein